jgi:DnaJ-class molecular chaperone
LASIFERSGLAMADDPYLLLGVPKGASQDDISKAFRKLAKELHPDLHPNDATAADRFKKVSAAYELLGDTEKRARFDRGEIDGSGEPRRGYNPFGGGGGPFPGGRTGRPGPGDDMGFGDIFSDLFGAGRARTQTRATVRGQDVRYTLDVEFLEAVTGAKKRVSLPEGGVLDLAVPEGVEDGQVLRLKGKGRPGPRGAADAGDALVEIKIRPHRDFKRTGDDIVLDLAVSIDEAVLGAKIEVPTASGRVALNVPKGTSSGTVFRLRGKGVRNMKTGTQGDQLVTVRIVLPDTIDEQLSYFMSEWRQKHGYDPRK